MVTVTVTPRSGERLYSLLVKKEPALKTFFRSAKKKAGEARWAHTNYRGWIRLQKCLGGVMVATVQSKRPDQEWQILSAFVGVLHRHFRDRVGTISISYDRSEG